METNSRALPVGKILSDYRIEGLLGQGAFGITYLAIDVNLNRKYAIKEYYPREFAYRDGTLKVSASGSKEDIETFKWGLERFLDEARILARFSEPNIIGVQRFFEANGTAYLVMDYCEGESLDEKIKKNGPLNKNQLEKILFPLLDGLEKVHKANFLHRDIKPANIFIRFDGTPVLLDFGAARQEIFSHSRSVTSLATPGYAAFEQYSSRGKQGPWTDIYGLAATMYRAVSGEKPQDSPDRILEDILQPLAPRFSTYFPSHILSAIDLGMSVRPELRPQNIKIWREMFKSANTSTKINQPRQEPSIDTEKVVQLKNKQGSKPLPLYKPARIDKTVGIIFSIGLLIIIYFSIFYKNTENNTIQKSVQHPKPVAIPNEIQSNKDLKFYPLNPIQALEGKWPIEDGNCAKATITFKASALLSGVMELNFGDAKMIYFDITSASYTKNKNIQFLLQRGDIQNEEEYQLIDANTIKLVRRIQIKPTKKILVINGKDFETESNINLLRKCK